MSNLSRPIRNVDDDALFSKYNILISRFEWMRGTHSTLFTLCVRIYTSLPNMSSIAASSSMSERDVCTTKLMTDEGYSEGGDDDDDDEEHASMLVLLFFSLLLLVYDGCENANELMKFACTSSLVCT